jgi:hypothetical protein
MQTRSVPASSAVHEVGSAPCGAHVVELQLEHSPELLQHARQNEMFGFAESATHVLHGWQNPEASHRSPVAPVGVQRPPWQMYPGAQSVATVAAVHWLLQIVSGRQNVPLPLSPHVEPAPH